MNTEQLQYSACTNCQPLLLLIQNNEYDETVDYWLTRYAKNLCSVPHDQHYTIKINPTNDYLYDIHDTGGDFIKSIEIGNKRRLTVLFK